MDGCFGARESTFLGGGGYIPHAKSPEYGVRYEAFACTEINWKTASVMQRLKPSLSINCLNNCLSSLIIEVVTCRSAFSNSIRVFS